MDTGPDVVVIGSGPAGLSSAAEPRACGVPVTVLEPGGRRRGRVGGSVRRAAPHHRPARLGSARRPLSAGDGQIPSRDQYVDYLRAYARDRGSGGGADRPDPHGPSSSRPCLRGSLRSIKTLVEGEPPH